MNGLFHPLIVESWESSENRKEVHFFLDGDQKVYVMGFNPAFIAEHTVQDLLNRHGFLCPRYFQETKECPSKQLTS